MIRKGDTLLFDAPPTVAAWAAAGGKKESEGPLASAFDFVTRDAGFGEQGCENWEQAESILQRKAAELCLRKADIPRTKVDIAFAGDLQAQQLHDAGAGRAVRGRVRRVFYDGRDAGTGRCVCSVRYGRTRHGADQQPFLRSRTAIPHTIGIRCQAHPYSPVDGHSGGSLPGAGARRAGRAGALGDVWPRAGF